MKITLHKTTSSTIYYILHNVLIKLFYVCCQISELFSKFLPSPSFLKHFKQADPGTYVLPRPNPNMSDVSILVDVVS